MSDPPGDRPRFFTDITDALGPDKIEIRNAGQLLMVLARLPDDVPIVLAETVRMDPRLREDDDRRTVVVAQVVPSDSALSCQEGVHQPCQPAVQLGTVVIGADAPGPPLLTVPWPAQQRAQEAVIEGELEPTLAAFAELLAWMATTLTASPDSDLDESAHLDRIEDANLRAAIEGVAEQLDHVGEIVSSMRVRVAEYEAAADLIDAAKEIVKSAADRS